MDFDKIAVTGGSGRLGRHVVAELARHADVTVLDKAPPRSAHKSAHNFVPLDVRDLPAVMAALAGHDAVVHLAAIDDGVPASPETYFATNVMGTWNVLHAAHELGIRKAAITSSVAALAIGRGPQNAAPAYLPADEAHPLQPNDPYSLSKEVAEAIGRTFARRGVTKIACLRPTFIVRDEVVGQIDNEARLADGDPSADPDFDISGLAEPSTEPLSVSRTYVGSDDAARAFRLAIEVDGAAYDVFNIAARDTIGRHDTLAAIERAFGTLPEIRNPEVFRADPAASMIDCGHAHAVLGWQAAGDWNDLVAEKTSALR